MEELSMAEGFTTAKATSILSKNIKSTIYIGLSSTVPNKDGSNFTEPASSTGYRRAPFGTVNTSISAQVANNDIIFVFEALEDCGSFTHVGLFDSATGGTPFLVGALTSAITSGSGLAEPSGASVQGLLPAI